MNNQAGVSLPAGWEVQPLGDLCRIRRELVEPSPNGSRRYVGLEHLDSGKARIARWDSERGLQSTKHCFYAGDVLYGKLRPYLDKAAIAEWDGVCSTDILTLEVKPSRADAAFVSFLLHTGDFLAHAVATTSGVNHPRTSWTDLAAFSHPTPPLQEQRAIAAILRSIQAAVDVQNQITAKLRELKTATIAKLFREGLRGEPFKQTEIGEIPESWEVAPLEQVARIERGKFTHRPRNDPRFFDGPFPFVQTGDVAQANGRIRTFSQTLNEAGLAVSRMFPAGTILLTIAANIADTGILEFDSAFPDSIVGLTPDATVDVHFLEFYLRTQKQAMDRLAPKGTQKNINIQFLRPWPVPRPPMPDQREIALSLTRLDQRAEASMDRGRILSLLFSATLHLLMSGQLRLSARE